ncbi:hypothetical protein HYDPIDRAFT_119193 [Hydnomerulius pinastri MD-312]|uniref:Heterokaryon incompatibility domain-containing protein n=1 Tax=Hydnomerulius pinastri MD-312 TaxID=994086 RepID=A0A0C9VMG6_9AGAM|nr:hypothetical protein HYDPIDRAFT_119193 [Hydnomerulius pinastri MD-312]
MACSMAPFRWSWFPFQSCAFGRRRPAKPMVCGRCATGPLAPQSWRMLMDGEKVMYHTSRSLLEVGMGDECALCALLLPWTDTRVDRTTDSEVEFTLNVTREEEDNGPSPKDAPRLRIEASSSAVWDEYCLYASPDDPAASEIITRRPLVQVDSTEAYKLALKQLNECIANHGSCPKPGPTPLPNRVIDCKDPSKPRLIITSGISSPYIALSYVWGSDASHITLLSNFDSYIAGIDPHIIPQTIRDAITVTHGLGMRYLWVDAFCIIQDSSEDKNTELVRMGQIYRDAYLTIIASSAAHANAGILHSRPMPEYYATHPRLPFHCRDGCVGTVSVFTAGKPDYEPMKEPVDHRAWCLQERLLSPRKLVYATDTLEYHCQTATVPVNNSIKWWGTERLNSLSFSLSDADITNKVAEWEEEDWGILQMEWVFVMSSYTRRSLTQKMDKLVAFAGAAEQFDRIWHTHSGRYIAGLWEKHLPRDLLWLREPWEFGWCDDPLRPRPQEYLAPSWSWASVEGHVRVKPPVDCDDDACEVLECDVTLMDERLPYGRVSGGRLKIRAAMVPAPCIISHESLGWYYKLLVPTEELRTQMTTVPPPSPNEGIIVGRSSTKEEGRVSTMQIVVRQEHMRGGLLAVVEGTDVERSLLTPVGTILLAFDSTERVPPDRAWAIVIYREDVGAHIHTEGLLVTDVDEGSFRRIGYWLYQVDRKGSDTVEENIPWLHPDTKKCSIELI